MLEDLPQLVPGGSGRETAASAVPALGAPHAAAATQPHAQRHRPHQQQFMAEHSPFLPDPGSGDGQCRTAHPRLKAEGTGVSLNALIMAAVAAALLRFPALNAGFGTAGIISYPHVNLAFAVALADGLQVPVIREAEIKNVRELTAAAVDTGRKSAAGLPDAG